MDEACLEAQRVVSETYDGEAVDPAAIQRARAHCAQCPECAAFVKALAAVRKLPAPAAPRPVVKATIAAVREEAAAAAAREQAAALAAATAPGQPREERAAPEAGVVTPRRTQSPWFAWGGWAAAAAVVLVLVGVLAVRGAGYIAGDADSADEQAMVENTQAAPPVSQRDIAGGAAAEEAAPASRAEYITVGAYVYRYTGTTDVGGSEVATLGTTLTALDTETAPRQFEVVSRREGDAVIVAEDRTLGFELVTRTLQGRTYAMQSRALSGFGQWPTLPDGFAEPTSDSGAPTFAPSISDDSGVAVYTPGGASPRDGFAVAPGTATSDPAAGNPNWTWWAPAP